MLFKQKITSNQTEHTKMSGFARFHDYKERYLDFVR